MQTVDFVERVVGVGAGAFRACTDTCPGNAFRLVGVPSDVDHALNRLNAVAIVAVVLGVLWLLTEKRRRGTLVRTSAT